MPGLEEPGLALPEVVGGDHDRAQGVADRHVPELLAEPRLQSLRVVLRPQVTVTGESALQPAPVEHRAAGGLVEVGDLLGAPAGRPSAPGRSRATPRSRPATSPRPGRRGPRLACVVSLDVPGRGRARCREHPHRPGRESDTWHAPVPIARTAPTGRWGWADRAEPAAAAGDPTESFAGQQRHQHCWELPLHDLLAHAAMRPVAEDEVLLVGPRLVEAMGVRNTTRSSHMAECVPASTNAPAGISVAYGVPSPSTVSRAQVRGRPT